MFEKEIKERIKFNGGFVNCHAHLDRAYTINNENLHLSRISLKEKWKLVTELKKNSTVDGILYRMSKVVENQINQGVTTLCTFLDFDEFSKNKPYLAFQKLKTIYGDKIKLYSVNQTLQGLEDEASFYWFDAGATNCDFIGALPGRDKDPNRHLDIVFKRANRYSDKKIHIHVDQFNSVNEKETELVLDKIEEYGFEGRVVLIHGISLACQEKQYREYIYKRLSDTETKIISCPSAWLDSPRSEELTPFHNSMTPIEEMVEYDIVCGIGTDNIADLMCPFINGNMYDELMLLAKGLRLYDIDNLVKIATTNGDKIICI